MAQNKRKGRPAAGKEGSDKTYSNESLVKVSKIIKIGVIHMIDNGFIDSKEVFLVISLYTDFAPPPILSILNMDFICNLWI